jgi:glycosyltransferase involved in cell wall biosynthesis
MTESPLVSCIMPTRNRARFVPQAIAYFLRQDYANRELVIVDDGDPSVESLVPSDARISYHRLPHRMPLGSKRNFACERSRGELIAHWDDDDWIGSHRLSEQRAQLDAAPADVCGAAELLYYRLDAGEAWRYEHRADGRPWLAGGTLFYRRTAWERHRFPELDAGEDAAFVWQQSAERVSSHSADSFYVAVLHAGNTAPKNLRDPRWRREPLDVVANRLGGDRRFYVELRRGRVERPHARAAPTSVVLCTPLVVYDGYGGMGEYLALGMRKAGADVYVDPLAYEPDGLATETRALVRGPRPPPDAPLLFFCCYRAEYERYAHVPDRFINTMWEGDRLPPGWTEWLNGARGVVVPTRFVAEACRASGVRSPVEVIPEGVDPTVYDYVERPEREGLTTLCVATVTPRKHVHEAIAAWLSAFEGDERARFVIKSRFGRQDFHVPDPRIRLVSANERTRGIREWYRDADILIAIGNEGFGLPLVEGMATGLPVVALASEGQRDVCEDAAGLVLTVPARRWVPCDGGVYGTGGVRGVPSPEDVADRLRWVRDHRDEARAMGRAASAWARQHRSIWAKGPAVLDFMEQRLRAPRALRRAETLWVPTWRTPCGIAEYARSLADHLPGVRVSGPKPPLAGARLLHVQHEHGIFDGSDLQRTLEAARSSRVPCIVTEHAVLRAGSPWEIYPNALIAHTARGADTLRLRSTAPVYCVPHGCPTWFPPRKPKRGRVLGVFGFLERRKGFWSLLDALRALPGVSLVMYSYARQKPDAVEWQAASAGAPVQRIADYMPATDVARRLANEADALVFWYDDIDHDSASGAVRVGLATGVPVLASRTRWFEELRDVTYQPSDLVTGVQHILDDTALRDRLTEAARAYCHDHSWPRTAERHRAIWRALER